MEMVGVYYSCLLFFTFLLLEIKYLFFVFHFLFPFLKLSFVILHIFNLHFLSSNNPLSGRVQSPSSQPAVNRLQAELGGRKGYGQEVYRMPLRKIPSGMRLMVYPGVPSSGVPKLMPEEEILGHRLRTQQSSSSA